MTMKGEDLVNNSIIPTLIDVNPERIRGSGILYGFDES